MVSGVDDEHHVLIAQLSDFHLGASWTDTDPADTVAAVVAAVAALQQQPDAIIVTGDLAEHAADSEYEHARSLLSRLAAPTYVLPGNHDDRRVMRRHFDVGGDDAAPIHYVVELAPLRIVMLDSTIPGADAGVLGAEQLGWLDETLASRPAKPTLVAMHHAPIRTGVPAWDDFGLAAADQEGLGRILDRHPQVRLVTGGHLHRSMTAQLARRPVFCAPSAYIEAELDFEARGPKLAAEPAGFAVHAFLADAVVSYVSAVAAR
jgi:3',5'-cyclic AMP phosphodiesterase CpdA